jgi:hypothetical protein
MNAPHDGTIAELEKANAALSREAALAKMLTAINRSPARPASRLPWTKPHPFHCHQRPRSACRDGLADRVHRGIVVIRIVVE